MSGLAERQSEFLRALLAGDAAPPGLRSTPAFPASRRFSVYANAYRRRLVEALASVFERAVECLGESAFETLALAYVETHPPGDRALGRYGLDFPDWLERQAGGNGRVAGVARIDAGLRRAFDAGDASPVGREALLALAPAQWAALRLDWAPALSTKAVSAASIGLWREPGAPPDDHDDRRLVVAFWRREGQTFFRSLEPDEARLLEHLREGASLAEACADERDGGIPAPYAAARLLAWIDDGWIAGIRVGLPHEFPDASC